MLPIQTSSKVMGFIIVRLAFRRDKGRWLGECIELGTATYGRAFEQTHRELVELVELHLNCLESVQERQRFFKENGIKFYTDGTAPEVVTKQLPVGTETFVDAHAFPVRV